MKPHLVTRLGVIVLVTAAAVVVLLARPGESETPPAAEPPAVDLVPAVAAPLPKMIDLGADKCIPCKKMAPILVALREDFAGRFDVVFIDVWKNKPAAIPYRIRVIPTQIFYDEADNELFRHEGFFSRADILDTWASFGYGFSPKDKGSEAG
jgi:thioredoxin 1